MKTTYETIELETEFLLAAATRVALVGVVALTLLVAFGKTASAQRTGTAGFVCVMTNDPAGNMVIKYARGHDGSLTKEQVAPTGGLGGAVMSIAEVDPLQSADSLIQNDNGSVLLAVNAGSNTIGALTVTSGGLNLASKIESGGTFPNSIALSGDLGYVLNAGGATPNITGFRLGADGKLTPIANSTVKLPGGAESQPHNIRFTPDGTRLVVTEGATNQIAIFELGNDGVVTRAAVEVAVGKNPFGFKFGRDQVLIVSEGASSSVSTYELGGLSPLEPITSVVSNGQIASCWLALTRTGEAFVSNTGNGTLSSYKIDDSGRLSLVEPVAAFERGSAPIDSALSSDGRFLYVQDSAMGRILGFQVNGTDLSPLEPVGGLPHTQQGIVAQ